jgi:hypothetical protein
MTLTDPIGDLERYKFHGTVPDEVFVKVLTDFGSAGSLIDTNNTTNTPILAGATYTGTPTDILGYGFIFVTVYSDQASATDGLVIEQGSSTDGITFYWDNDDKYTIPAAKGKTFSVQPASPYLRIRYINSGVDQTAFRLSVVLKKTNSLSSSHRIQDSIIEDDDAILTKSVITAKTDAGPFVNLGATNSNNLRVSDAENGLAIAKGDVAGTSYIHKFGAANSFDVDDGFVDIWDGANNAGPDIMHYTFSTSAIIDSLSSSNAGDTQDISISGLDTNWLEVTQIITLNGQTRVPLTTNLIRVFRMQNRGSVDLNGVVYCYENTAIVAGVPTDGTKVRAIINNGNNQTLMAIYTIPAGKTGYMRDWYASLAVAKRTSSHLIHLDARIFGEVFALKHVSAIVATGTSYIQHSYEEPEKFLEKTDILMHANTDEASAAIGAGFDIVLVDN